MLYSRVIAFSAGLMRWLLLFIVGFDVGLNYWIQQQQILIWFTSYFAYSDLFQSQRIAFRLFDHLPAFWVNYSFILQPLSVAALFT